MGRNFVRSVKYFLYIVVLYVVLVWAMKQLGYSTLGEGDIWEQLFSSQKGLGFLGVVLVVAIMYPKFGFVSRRVRINMTIKRDQIAKEMASVGFIYQSHLSSKDVMVFRAATLSKKVFSMWEDQIEIYDRGEAMVIDGIRREVVRLAFILENRLRDEE